MASARPDRAQVVVRVSSTKEAAAEAKKSVSRRLDYVAQSLRQQGVQAENIIVTKDFRRVENAYHMEAERSNSGPYSCKAGGRTTELNPWPNEVYFEDTPGSKEDKEIVPELHS